MGAYASAFSLSGRKPVQNDTETAVKSNLGPIRIDLCPISRTIPYDLGQSIYSTRSSMKSEAHPKRWSNSSGYRHKPATHVGSVVPGGTHFEHPRSTERRTDARPEHRSSRYPTFHRRYPFIFDCAVVAGFRSTRGFTPPIDSSPIRPDELEYGRRFDY